MVWNFKPQLRAFKLEGHSEAVHSVAFAPNGELIASGSADRTVRLWRPTGKGSSSCTRTRYRLGRASSPRRT